MSAGMLAGRIRARRDLFALRRELSRESTFVTGFTAKKKKASQFCDLVRRSIQMDDFRIMNAIAPSAQPPAEAADTPKAIELSEQTPLSGFDRKQRQVEAGEISDVGASIALVGQGRPSDAAAANYGAAAAVGWEETKAVARADEDDAYASGLLAESADAAEKGVHLGERVHERLVDQRRAMEGAGYLLTDLRRIRTEAGAFLEEVRRRKTRRRNCLVGVAALLSVVDAGLFYALCKGHGSFWGS